MKYKNFLFVSIGIIFTIVTKINDLIQFSENINKINFMEMLPIISKIGELLLTIFILYLCWLVGKMYNFFTNEKIEYKKYIKVKNEFDTLKKHNQDLLEGIKENSKYLLPYTRLVRDVILKYETKEIIARRLLENNFNKNDLEIIKFDEEIITEFLKIAHEKEAIKLRNK